MNVGVALAQRVVQVRAYSGLPGFHLLEHLF